MTKIEVRGRFITLGQCLKVAGVIDTGGMARDYLEQHPARVNGEEESRRGRKLFPGDHVEIGGNAIEVVPGSETVL